MRAEREFSDGVRGPVRPPRILVVEDERIVALDITSTLRRLGYHVAESVPSGEAAVEAARKTDPDLVLMDIRLAGRMDGVSAAETIVSEKDAPIIFLTAHSDNDTLRRVRASRPYGYLLKPFRAEDLRCAIEVSLHSHATDARLRRALLEIERLNAGLEATIAARTLELRAANDELEAYSYSLAHDLRSPLRAIDGFVQTLIEDYGPSLDEAPRELMLRVRRTAQRALRLIVGLLRLAQLTQAQLKHESVDLSAMANDICEELAATDRERKAQFVVAPGMRAVGDRTLLQVVLNNLLSNAWKFTAHNPRARIEFGCTNEGDRCVYFVRDNGVGFDSQNARDIFKNFQRFHGDRFPGDGIGLAMVDRAIKRMRGRVWAVSSPDRGASFFFDLGANGDERINGPH